MEEQIMLTSEVIKRRAKELGASLCGIGGVYEEPNPQRDPRSILPNAKAVIGFGFAVPKGLYLAMENGSQYYGYTTLGVKYEDEEMMEIFLLKMGAMIEDAGYDACLQKAIPNLRIQGDKTTNPEVLDTYELVHARAVRPGQPVPDVILDFGRAAKNCGIGEQGMSGRIVNAQYGPFMRYCFLITDAPLELDAPLAEPVCDHCGKCMEACPGHAISKDGLDTWQCSVYYKGAHETNPFLTEDFLKDDPQREQILKGQKRFDAQSSRKIYKEMQFLPNTQWGYSPCLCGKKCDLACYRHLMGTEGEMTAQNEKEEKRA